MSGRNYALEDERRREVARAADVPIDPDPTARISDADRAWARSIAEGRVELDIPQAEVDEIDPPGGGG